MSDPQYSGLTQASPEDDPSRSPRFISSSLLEEQPLTQRKHIDADLHWIGESLPVPSAAHARSLGVSNSIGTVPFPARADHVHQQDAVFGLFNSGDMTISPGQMFINNFNYHSGRDMRASGQIFSIPVPGLYMVLYHMHVDRQGGGNFINELIIRFYYSNGSYGREVFRTSMFDIPSYFFTTVVDIYPFYGAPSASDNVQIAIAQNDSANWSVRSDSFSIVRLSTPTSA
jgi:hypothetical protein